VADHNGSPPAPPPIAPGPLGIVRYDALAGFLVFLIAMPLCLGIAKASQFPPIVGIWTAVIGGILTGFISNSQLTIKGPAAGLIVVLEAAVLELGRAALPGETDILKIAAAGYPLALGVGVTAGVLQILFGLLKAGKVGEMVPLTPVHGMLAAIGLTIMAKQLFVLVGMGSPAGAPIKSFLELPSLFEGGVGPVATIGIASLAIMIAFPYLKGLVPALKPVPAQLVVLLVAVPLGMVLLTFEGAVRFLVDVPNVTANPSQAFFFPNFEAVATPLGVKHVLMIALIASIESMLSSQAIDMIDPWRRKTDQNRDLLATGVANTACACVGALPMISEIVRSKANIDSGARTKAANQFHGLFLLVFVLASPVLIRMIPMAALAAMLVFTGFRLASPREFISTYKLGVEQLVVFVTTIAVTLSTDLLVGVVSGVALKAVIHLLNGAPLRSMFLLRADIEVASTGTDRRVVLVVKNAALFSNWLALRGAILRHADNRDEVVLDLSQARLVDHSTMEKLHELERSFADLGKALTVVGLDKLSPMSSHPLAARKGGARTSTQTPALTR
jgi:MFS superfamily sulfate permease-like transporter